MPYMRSGSTSSPRPGSLRWVVLLAVICVLASACAPFVEIRPTGASLDLRPPVSTSTMLDADGNVIAELRGEQDREPVGLLRIPEGVRSAVIAVEDARFYEHVGVDAQAIARALVVNTVERDIIQGGSTITQQLIKNAITGDDQTVDRKLTEASLAIQLEAEMTKDQILEAYLNTVYFGAGSYGIGAAARRYFGLDVGALELHHAALLAGMLRAPSKL